MTFVQRDTAIVIVGDGVGSVFDQPDENTAGMCLMSRTDTTWLKEDKRTSRYAMEVVEVPSMPLVEGAGQSTPLCTDVHPHPGLVYSHRCMRIHSSASQYSWMSDQRNRTMVTWIW